MASKTSFAQSSLSTNCACIAREDLSGCLTAGFLAVQEKSGGQCILFKMWFRRCRSALAVPGVAAPFSLFGLNRFHGLGERIHPVRKGRKLMPASSKPETSAIHRVLIDSGVDPKLIHPAIEEMRNLSGQNVITAIGAQITELRSDVHTQIIEHRSDVHTQITELRSDIDRLEASTKADTAEVKEEIGRLEGRVFRALWIQGAGIVGLVVGLTKLL